MIDKTRIPQHIAIIMDGNGRWAKKKNLPVLAGHNAGMAAMKEIVKSCSVLGVGYLTVYAFSTENWKRSFEEVNGIFKLLIIYVDRELRELHENNVKINIIGDYTKLPKDAIKRLEKSLKTTEKNTGMQFNIALNYGSRDEIVKAAQSLALQMQSEDLSVENITEELFSAKLSTAGIPDPELLIRTSGEKRLSNFLMWQCAYSELIFTDVLWPDFTPEELEKAIVEFQNRKRRFGGR